MLNALKQAPAHDRFERIQLQLSGLRGHGHRDVVADYFERDLVHHFRNHRIDFARHDRRACLPRGQFDVAEARLRTTGEQAQVVAGFAEFGGDALQHA